MVAFAQKLQKFENHAEDFFFEQFLLVLLFILQIHSLELFHPSNF